MKYKPDEGYLDWPSLEIQLQFHCSAPGLVWQQGAVNSKSSKNIQHINSNISPFWRFAAHSCVFQHPEEHSSAKILLLYPVGAGKLSGYQLFDP